MSTIKTVATAQAPTPAGHYSQATVHAGLVYVAGQLGIVPGSGQRLQAVADQTRQALHNIDAILQAAGSSRDRVLKVNVYVSDIGLWDQVNEVYTEFFGDHRPARAVVPTGPLHHGLCVEIDAIAAVP